MLTISAHRDQKRVVSNSKNISRSFSLYQRKIKVSLVNRRTNNRKDQNTVHYIPSSCDGLPLVMLVSSKRKVYLLDCEEDRTVKEND